MKKVFIIIIVLSFTIFSNSSFAQCGVLDTIIDIPDNEEPIGIQLLIDGIVNNDLSDPDQGVCGITLKYDHQQRFQLTIDLISPAGQKVGLVGPYNPFLSKLTGNINWDISFVPCGYLAAPDSGKKERFSNEGNAIEWGLGGPYTGVYYPNKECLDSFNVGPVNGTWTLLVHDHKEIYKGHIYGFTIEFCDGTIIDCDLCSANSGYFNINNEYQFCEDELNRSIDIITEFEDENPNENKYNYQYILHKDDLILSVSNEVPDINGLIEGEYEICGFSYFKFDSTALFDMMDSVGFYTFLDSIENVASPYCADLTDTCISFSILPIANIIVIDTSICKGDTLEIEELKLYEEGEYYISSVYSNCDTAYVIKVKVWNLNASIDAAGTEINCPLGYVILKGIGFEENSGMNFKWNGDFTNVWNDTTAIAVSKAGVYEFVISAGLCSDTVSIMITSDIDVPKLEYDIQELNCNNDSARIIISSPNTEIDSVKWYGDNNDIYTGKIIYVKDPGLYSVIVTDTAGCGALDMAEVSIDTLIPHAQLFANDFSCNADSVFIDFVSNDSLDSIYWIELDIYSEDVYVSTAGLYHVEYTGFNGCKNIDSILINQYDSIVYTINADTLNCRDLTVLIDLETDKTGLNYLWVTPRNDTFETEDIIADTAGIYRITIIESIDCEIIDIYEVIMDDSPPDLTLDIDTFVISCGNTVQLSFKSSDIIDSVIWKGPGGFISNKLAPIINLQGIYELTIFGLNHCKNSDEVIVIADNTFPEIKIFTDTINCLDKTANLNVKYTGNYKFKWEDPLHIIHTGSTISSFSSGIFYLTVTDLNNTDCESYFFTEVPIDTMPPIIDILPSNEFDCLHDSVYLTYSSTLETIEAYWSGGGLNDYKDTVLILNSGLYFLDITATNHCKSSDSIFLEHVNNLEINPDTFYLTCENNRIAELSLEGVNDSFDFNWSGNGFSSNESSPEVINIGKYQVTVSDGLCTDTTFIMVFYDTLAPNVTISFDSLIQCNPDFSILEADFENEDNLFEFSWTGPGFNSNKLIDKVYEEGHYIFSASLNNGCFVEYEFDIVKSQDYPEIKAIGDTIDCISGIHTLEIEAEVEDDYTFLFWVFNGDSISVDKLTTVSDSGIYILRVTNDLGCTSNDTAYVTIDTLPPNIWFNQFDTITCYNDSIDLFVNTDATNPTITWQGPFGFLSNEQTIKVANAGEYLVEVIGENSCISNEVTEVIVNKLEPYISLKSSGLNCCGSEATIDLTTSSSNFINSWSGPNDFSSNAEDISIDIEGIYIVHLTDIENGCDVLDSINMVWDSIKPHVYSQDYYLPCDGSDIEMLVNSDSEGNAFTWSGPNGFYSFGSKAYTNISGTYKINFESSQNCCQDSIIINVYDTPIYPEFEAYGNEINCLVDSTIIRAIGVGDDESFLWTGPDNFVSNKAEPYVNVPGDYTLTVTGMNFCVKDTIISVVSDTIKPNIEVSFLDSLICEKQNGQLNINILNEIDVKYAYEWYSINGNIIKGKYSKIPYFEGEGTYFVHVTNLKNGCRSLDSILILSQTYQLDSINVSIVEPSCYEFSDGMFKIDSVFGGIGPFSYSLDNYWFSNLSEFNSKQAGDYKLYVKDAYGCRLDTIILIEDGADVQLKLGVDKDNIFIGDSVNVKAIILSDNSIENYYWIPESLFEFNDTTFQVIYPSKSLEVSLIVVDANGCKDEDSVWIKVKGKPDIFIPNIFTPDDDGINDYFYMKSGVGVKSINKLLIFDRWGEKIFDKNNLRLNVPIDGWNGKYNNRNVESGVYIYYFILEFENGDIENYTGDITIIK